MFLIAPLIAMSVIVIGATATGNQQALCERMGGTYTPAGPDICPGGTWSHFFANVPKPTPQK